MPTEISLDAIIGSARRQPQVESPIAGVFEDDMASLQPISAEPVTADDVMCAANAWANLHAASHGKPGGHAAWKRTDEAYLELARTILAFGRECSFTGEVK